MGRNEIKIERVKTKLIWKEEEVMCGCKEIACEVMICWNLKIENRKDRLA